MASDQEQVAPSPPGSEQPQGGRKTDQPAGTEDGAERGLEEVLVPQGGQDRLDRQQRDQAEELGGPQFQRAVDGQRDQQCRGQGALGDEFADRRRNRQQQRLRGPSGAVVREDVEEQQTPGQ